MAQKKNKKASGNSGARPRQGSATRDTPLNPRKGTANVTRTPVSKSKRGSRNSGS